MKIIITSTANAEIKLIRKLQLKKNRDESGLFFAEGIRPVLEAAKQKADIQKIIYCPAILHSEIAKKFIEENLEKDFPFIEVDEKVFQSIASKEGPQGIAAVIKQKWYLIDEIFKETTGIWIGLDSVQDPGNLGSILRTLDAIGGTGIILLDQTTDAYHPTAVRASMGAIFTKKMIKLPIDQFIQWNSKSEIFIYGTDCLKGIDYQKVDYPDRIIILMGSEQKGLDQRLADVCDGLIHIPMRGKVDSLNLSNAASIILYEVYNQVRRPKQQAAK
jgi:RNA methyltransferase, TrmH family